MKFIIRMKGGSGSGNFGHAGRKGQLGGSAPAGGGGGSGEIGGIQTNVIGAKDFAKEVDVIFREKGYGSKPFEFLNSNDSFSLTKRLSGSGSKRRLEITVHKSGTSMGLATITIYNRYGRSIWESKNSENVLDQIPQFLTAKKRAIQSE